MAPQTLKAKMRRALFGVWAAVLALTLSPLYALSAPPHRATAVSSALAALRERASLGDAQAQYDLAVALLCGTQVPRNPVEAARLMASAADRGHIGAQSVLGWMHMTGTGLRRDDAQAVHWLRQAAQGRDTAAANNLGVLDALGQGVEQDHAQAERWFGVAADRGASDAVRNLKVLRASPEGGGLRRAAVIHVLHPALVGANCRL